jgi:uncharacterized protein YndB with AHSA1/START domain
MNDMARRTTTNSDTFTTATPTDTAIEMTRWFDAPRDLVFEVMTTPEHIRQWWGCLDTGYSVPVCEVDLRVGGKWKFVNRTPNGELATFYGEYREISRPDRLVFTEIYEPYPDAESIVTTVLVEQDGRTHVTITATYPSREVRDLVISTGMEQGAALSYDRLEDLLARLRG